MTQHNSNVSPGVAQGAKRAAVSSASEFKARKIFYRGVAALKNNALDAADLSPAFRERLLQFYRDLATIEPPAADWDKAMGMTTDHPRPPEGAACGSNMEAITYSEHAGRHK